jgi:hypothetical protein
MATTTSTVAGTTPLLDLTKTLTVAGSLTKDDSGYVCYLKSATGRAINLPAPLAGFKLTVITAQTFASTAWTFISTGANIRGGVLVNSAFVESAGTTTVTLSASAETLGDFFQLTSDGTSYFISGNFKAATGCAFS